MDRRLIVTADDFGMTSAVNAAVAEAHDAGVLTCASLMVNGEAFAEAVALARERPGLGVGLHLALCGGRATLPAAVLGDLVRSQGFFRSAPVAAGLAYFFRARLRKPLEQEIAGQLAKFQATGLVLDHVNGHLQMHEHPTVFRFLLQQQASWRGAGFRLVRDPLRVSARLARGRWFYRLSHALVFGLLAWSLAPRLRRAGVRLPGAVFGLLENGQVTEDYLVQLLDRLPAGDSEVYAHPCRERAPHELAALLSPRVRRRCETLGIRRIRYADL